MNEFIQKLHQIEKQLDNVSHQMQELREAVRSAPRSDEELRVREHYEHPWYKYKREELVASRNYYEQLEDRDQGI
jgi:gamma-glutamyl:cysteine ligase YbdK (ATP-grasp superfamily)